MTDMTDIVARTPESGPGRTNDITALGELSAVLAHELRNPLSSIKGAAQILLQEWGQQKPQNEFLAIILDEVEALTALTTEFLDFARPLYPELTWSSWNDIVERAVESVQPLAETAGIRIDLETAADLDDVLTDRFQLERAVRNLVLNAMEASRRGGSVTVRTLRTENGVAVAVTDQGCGIPPEQMARLFVPFFTTKLTGTGLGLPVARKIAQQHGGDVTAVRNDGPGMTFLIHLPASGES